MSRSRTASGILRDPKALSLESLEALCSSNAFPTHTLIQTQLGIRRTDLGGHRRPPDIPKAAGMRRASQLLTLRFEVLGFGTSCSALGLGWRVYSFRFCEVYCTRCFLLNQQIMQSKEHHSCSSMRTHPTARDRQMSKPFRVEFLAQSLEPGIFQNSELAIAKIRGLSSK